MNKSGPSDGTTPLGYKLLNGLFLGIALWGRFPWWGGHRPLGTKVPHNDSPEGRGGPWAPPPRVFFSKLCCSLLVSCLILQTVCSLKGLLLWECLLGYLSPSSFRPLSVLGVRFHDVDGLFWTYFLAFLFGVGQMSCFSLFFLSLSFSLSFSLSLSLVRCLKRQRSG